MTQSWEFLIQFLVAFCLFDVMVKAETSQLSLITTNPVLPNNEIAYGFRGLQFITQVPQSNLYRSCSWNYPNRGFIDLFRDFLPCENRFALTCVNVSNVVHTTYTNEDPIINGNTVSLSCNSNNTRVSNAFTYRVKRCSTVPPLIVHSATTSYNSNGSFSCENNGTLFYSNRSQVFSPQTTCLVTGEWSGQNDLECWRAPNVTLRGVVSAVVGSKLQLDCVYEDVVPKGTSSAFYVRNTRVVRLKIVFQRMYHLTKAKNAKYLQIHTLLSFSHDDSLEDFVRSRGLIACDKGEPHSFTVMRSDHATSVYCQAVTPYTELVNNTGRSKNVLLDIRYGPYRKSPAECNWRVNEKGICAFSFTSNPTSTFVSLIKNGATLPPSSTNISVQNQVHWFSYVQNKVTFDDEGPYTLVLSSTIFGESSLSFFVNLNQSISEDPSSIVSDPNVTIIAVCVTVVVVVIIFAVVIFVVKKRKSKTNRDKNPICLQTGKQNPISSTQMSNTDLHNDSQTYEETENDEGKYDDVIVEASENSGRKNGKVVGKNEDPINPLEGEKDEDGYLKINVPSNRPTSQHVQSNLQRTSRNYVNLHDNVSVDIDKDGYTNLAALAPDVKVSGNKQYVNIPDSEYETINVSKD